MLKMRAKKTINQLWFATVGYHVKVNINKPKAVIFQE